MLALSDLPIITLLVRGEVKVWIQFLILPLVLSYSFQELKGELSLFFTKIRLLIMNWISTLTQFSLQPFYPPSTWWSRWIVQRNAQPSQRVGSSNGLALTRAKGERTSREVSTHQLPFLSVYHKKWVYWSQVMILGKFLIFMTCFLFCKIGPIILPV